MKTNLTNWLSALCAVLLIILLVLQTNQKSALETLRREHQAFASVAVQRQQEARDAVSKLADQVATVGTNLESRLVQDEQQANEKLGEMMNTVQQNTAVMNRALGKVIPVELPESLTNQLAALEARIVDENSWPKDSTNADAMLAELRDLVRQIPPWAEEDYLPRLNVLRWAVQSLQVLQTNANAQGDALDDASDAYANQISIQPDGASTNIAAALIRGQQDTATRFAWFRRESAIKDAKKQLDLPAMSDALDVWQRLSEWTNNPTGDQQVVELRRQLHARLLDDDIAKFVGTTKASLQKLDGMTNDALRQAGYVRTLDTLTIQRLTLLEQPDLLQNARNDLDNLSKTVEDTMKREVDKQRDSEKKRSYHYQAWALEQIKAFDAGYELVKQKKISEQKQVATDSFLRDIFLGGIAVFPMTAWDITQILSIKPEYKTIAADMTQCLLPISPVYLDTAVSKLYAESFEKGWDKLGEKGGMSLRTLVAQQEAIVSKKTPSDPEFATK